MLLSRDRTADPGRLAPRRDETSRRAYRGRLSPLLRDRQQHRVVDLRSGARARAHPGGPAGARVRLLYAPEMDDARRPRLGDRGRVLGRDGRPIGARGAPDRRVPAAPHSAARALRSAAGARGDGAAERACRPCANIPAAGSGRRRGRAGLWIRSSAQGRRFVPGVRRGRESHAPAATGSLRLDRPGIRSGKRSRIPELSRHSDRASGAGGNGCHHRRGRRPRARL